MFSRVDVSPATGRPKHAQTCYIHQSGRYTRLQPRARESISRCRSEAEDLAPLTSQVWVYGHERLSRTSHKRSRGFTKLERVSVEAGEFTQARPACCEPGGTLLPGKKDSGNFRGEVRTGRWELKRPRIPGTRTGFPGWIRMRLVQARSRTGRSIVSCHSQKKINLPDDAKGGTVFRISRHEFPPGSQTRSL